MLNYEDKSTDPHLPACASTRADFLFVSTKQDEKPIAAVVECKGQPVSEVDDNGVEVLFAQDALGAQSILDLAAADTNFVVSVRKSGFSVIAKIRDRNGMVSLAKIPSGNKMLSFKDPKHQILFVKICFAFGRISGIPFPTESTTIRPSNCLSSFDGSSDPAFNICQSFELDLTRWL